MTWRSSRKTVRTDPATRRGMQIFCPQGISRLTLIADSSTRCLSSARVLWLSTIMLPLKVMQEKNW